MELTRSLGISLAAGNDRGGIQRVLRDQDCSGIRTGVMRMVRSRDSTRQYSVLL